jgi:hypothetical protein
VTLDACEVYVALMFMVVSMMAVAVIIVHTVAYTVFLHSGTVIDGV